jgi:hypothetical protein
MAIIPQYSAGDPASRGAPVLEKGQHQAVSTADQQAALHRNANIIEHQTAKMPGVDPNGNQTLALGLAGLGREMSDIHAAMEQVKAQEIEARNFADVAESQRAMDFERGEFAKWQDTHRDPRTWEKEWGDRVSNFTGKYFEGKDFTPEATQGITQRFLSYSNTEAIKVGVSAVKRTTEMAREGLYADHARAVAAKNYPASKAISDHGLKQGWIGEDDKANMDIAADAQIKNTNLKIAQAQVATFLMQGNPEGAVEVIRKQDLEPAEKERQITQVWTRDAVNITTEEAKNRISDDPIAGKKWLYEQGSDGKYINSHVLGSHDRNQLGVHSDQELELDRAELMKPIMDEIHSGGIKTQQELSFRLAGTELGESEIKNMVNVMNHKQVKSLRAIDGYAAQVANYDANNDPGGVRAGYLDREIQITVPPEQAKPLRDALAERVKNPGMDGMTKAMTASLSHKRKNFDQAEKHRWEIPIDSIVEVDLLDGNKGYAVKDENVEDGDPHLILLNASTKFDKFKQAFDSGADVPQHRYRKIQLDYNDVPKWIDKDKNKGLFLTDIFKENEAITERRAIEANIEERNQKNEFDTIEKFNGALDGAYLDNDAKAATATLHDDDNDQFEAQGVETPGEGGKVSSGLFPKSPDKTASQRLDELEKKTK